MARVMAVAMDVMDRPWEWGAADCCTSACDVFLRLYGTDPMAPLRGRYRTQREAQRLIAGYGGWGRMADALAAGSGLVRCDPREGAIGVSEHGLCIAVSPWAWLGKTEHGLSTLRDVERCYHVAQ